MPFLNSIFNQIMSSRMYQIERFMEHPLETQDDVFHELVLKGARTDFGLDHFFVDIKDVETYRKNVPIRNYEEIYPYIERTLKGE